MTDDPYRRLQEQGGRDVPGPDGAFADRLEAGLRVQHSERAPQTRRRLAGVLPRLGVAFALVIVGLIGAVALTGRDAGVPIAVIDEEPVVPAADGDGTNEGTATPVAGAVTEPTATPVPAPPTVGPVTAPEPTESPGVEPSATSAPSAADQEPTSVARPTTPATTPAPAPTDPTPTPVEATPVPPTTVPSPTSAPAPTSTPVPTPTSTVAAEPTSTPEPNATEVEPEPTATEVPAEPAMIELDCMPRTSGDAVGVVCTWSAPDVAVVSYRVLRSKDGSDAEVVSRQRATAPLAYVDRDVDFGDQVTYLVNGLNPAGEVIAASVRNVVDIAPQ